MNILMSIQSEFEVKRPIDDKLILRISEGDTTALKELYENVSSSVYGFALSITKNSHDADDVLQETFLKVYSKAGEYIPQGKPMAWIFTIARNLALSRLREHSRLAEIDEDHPQSIDFSCISDAEHKILIETLFKILGDEEKQILMLHAVSGMKHREIAKILELSLGTVLSKYNRAIKKLKIAVSKEEE